MSTLNRTIVVRNPETLEAVALVEGSELPDWATDLVDKGNLGTPEGSSDGGKGYDGMKAEELQAEADKRGLTVEGTGKDGNVLKSDLVTALNADDA